MSHTTEIKIRGYHLDLYGHVNNARYLEFLEEARWAVFESHVDIQDWIRRRLAFIVVNINISYRKPASLGTVLQIRSFVSRLGNSSGVIRQEVYDRRSGALTADADVTFVIADGGTGRALPIQGVLREELERLPFE